MATGYDSKDESRNNWLFGILAFGEGWQIGVTYYILVTLSFLGVVSDLKTPTKEQLQAD